MTYNIDFLIAAMVILLLVLWYFLGQKRAEDLNNQVFLFFAIIGILVDPYDLKATEEVVTEELAAPEPSVIITRRPCVLLRSVEKHPPYQVEPDKCKGCKMCMRIGCPAISWKDKKAVIDPTQCVGCGV